MSKDLLKWVLIAGAAYLVYRYLSQMASSATQQATAALPDTTGTTVPAATVVVEPGTEPVTVAASPTVAQSLSTVMRQLGYDPQGSYTGYEWAYFWERTPIYNGTAIGPTELGIGESEKAPLSVAVAAIRKILSGVAGLSRLPFPSHQMMSAWSM
jgi:hypothetical protein